LHNKRHIGFFLALSVLLIAMGCSTEKNTSQSRWWQSFTARYNTFYNGSLAYIDGALEKENGNKDNYTEMIPLYTIGNKGSIDLGKSNFERAITKCEKAIHQHSIKRRPEWNKQRRKTEADIEWLSRREYNPFLWKAWLLMGRSQFYKGALDDAASTFAYMSRLYATQPAIYGKARAWLAKCYIEQGWMYDAEDVIRNMQRDSMDWRAVKEWDYTYTDYYIHTGEFDKAIPYLKKVIKHEMRHKQKAREWYLMGQLEAAIGHRDLANKSFRHVIRQNPPYELEFNSRIAMTEVLAHGQAKKMISRLKRMAASDKNKEYLDQVYYAIGNIYLAEKDTTQAISAYETGNKKATRNGIEKGVLLLHLGDIYWQREKFSDARRCYGEAIGLLDKERKDYAQLSERSKVLDELVPFTETVQLQDSLQSLAKMSEKDRNAAIDRVIEALKKKEKEQRDSQAVLNAQQTQMKNGGMGNFNQQKTTQTTDNTKNGLWYFYNPSAVSQGKATFQRIWGKRENVDNWQRINKSVVSGLTNDAGMTDQVRDSIAKAQTVEDSLKHLTDSAQNDPHKREYYLAQIPFTEEQLQASNKLLEDGLYNSGVIFKDKLDKLALSEKALRRLADKYLDYEKMDDVYYHLFLLYSRLNESNIAEAYVQKLKKEYPKSQWTTILSDPYFKENAALGTHLEDSLYAATYEAFKADRYTEVNGNAHVSETRFPQGANRDKFIFISGLSKLNGGDATGCLDEMKTVVEKFPESKLSEMAGMIINGVKAGKKLRGGKFDIGNVWERRSVVLNDSDSIAAKKFSTDRNLNFTFVIAYKPDSINENQLLFELAKYNFTSFLVRNFDISTIDADGLRRMQISGFRNYDEALQYARQLFDQKNITKLLGDARTIIISEPNLEMLGTQFSYDDYDKFYSKHFAPLKISTYRLLTEPAEISTEKEPEPTPEEIDKTLDNGMFIDNGINVKPENGTDIIEEPKNDKAVNGNTGTNIILNQEKQVNKQGTDVIIKEEQPKSPVNNDSGTIIIPDEKTTKPTVTKPAVTKPAVTKPTVTKPTVTAPTVTTPTITKPTAPTVTAPTITKPAVTKPVTKPQPKQPEKPVRQKDDTGIYFDDGFGMGNDSTPSGKKQNAVKPNSNTKTTNNTKPTDNPKDKTTNKTTNKTTDKKPETKPQKKKFDLEDEYYDLDGF
jgi:tetratricopeptide (TPR) repeat protein